MICNNLYDLLYQSPTRTYWRLIVVTFSILDYCVYIPDAYQTRLVRCSKTLLMCLPTLVLIARTFFFLQHVYTDRQTHTSDHRTHTWAVVSLVLSSACGACVHLRTSAVCLCGDADVSVGNSQQAAHCTTTYLLFRPNDETMLQNKDYYMQRSSASESDFTPRQVSNKYCSHGY